MEAKNRVSLPAKFREKLGGNGVITRGLDGCLFIFDEKGWKKQIAQVENLVQTKKANRDYVRHLSNDAQEIEIDGQGRMRVSEDLKHMANLEKEVVFVGSVDHIEVWDRETYHEYMSTVEEHIEDTAESIEVDG